MAEELTQEEKDAAAKINEKAANEKTEMEKIGETLTGVDTLVKSLVEDKEKKEDGDGIEENQEIDFEKIVPEDLAKSFKGDTDKAKEYISKLTEACNIMPQDMTDEDGERFIDDEMLKSLQDSEETGQRYLSGIFHAMQESNERTVKKDAVNMQLLIDLAKSVTGLHGVMGELQKSMVPVEKSVPKEENILPLLGESAGQSPLSLQGQGAIEQSTGIDYNQGLSILKKAFPGNFGNIEESAKYEEYVDYTKKNGFEEALNIMSDDDRAVVISCIPA